MDKRRWLLRWHRLLCSYLCGFAAIRLGRGTVLRRCKNTLRPCRHESVSRSSGFRRWLAEPLHSGQLHPISWHRLIDTVQAHSFHLQQPPAHNRRRKLSRDAACRIPGEVVVHVILIPTSTKAFRHFSKHLRERSLRLVTVLSTGPGAPVRPC